MRLPFVSRARYDDLDAQRRYTVSRLAEADEDQTTVRMVNRCLARELDACKQVIAEHLVAAKHPSSALSDAHSMAIALQEALEAHGVDLRIELARLEGADL